MPDPTDKRLVFRGNREPVWADPFRRHDVDYTTVSWMNPVTGEEQVWSIPVEFLVTFFAIDTDKHSDYELVEYEKNRKRWLETAMQDYHG